jgi:hypothetical protein
MRKGADDRTNDRRPGLGSREVALQVSQATPSARASQSVAGKSASDPRDAYKAQEVRLGIKDKFPRSDENQRDAFRHGFTSGAVFGSMPDTIGDIGVSVNNFGERVTAAWRGAKDPDKKEYYATSADNDSFNNSKSVEIYRELTRELGREPTANEFGDRVWEGVQKGEFKFQRDDTKTQKEKTKQPAQAPSPQGSRSSVERQIERAAREPGIRWDGIDRGTRERGGFGRGEGRTMYA